MTQAFPLPDDALDADIAILGKKGRGKTYTAKGVVERLLAMERRVLVLDPLSVWWGLKSNAAGDGPGFEVAVFGGPHGDMPLTERAARPLARILAENNLPAVIDMGEMRKAAWQRLVRDMLDELFTANRDPLWIVLEEADVFAPQQPREGDSAAVLGEVDRIARRGRAYGFRLISITQRPARLHKDVLTQLSTLIALGMTSPQDRDAIKAWVEGNADRDAAKEVMGSLAKLPVGEGWVWAPDHDILSRVKFPEIATLDTSATPKAGERRIEPTDLAKVDLSAFTEALSEAEEPERKATPKVKALDLEKAEARGREAGFAQGREAGFADAIAELRRHFTQVLDSLDGERAPASLLTAPSPPPQPLKRDRTAPKPRQQDGSPPAAALRMLDVLDTNPPVRMSWNALAASIGNKARGGHFNTVRKWLVENGRIVEEGGLVRIAEPSGDAPAAPTGAELGALLRERWKSILGGRSAQIIDVLYAHGPISKLDVAGLLGVAATGGHWNSSWAALRQNDLIEDNGGLARLKGEISL